MQRMILALILAGMFLPIAVAHEGHETHAERMAAAEGVAAAMAPAYPGSFGVQMLMRWTHILTAVVVVGGSVFMRLVLLPAAAMTLDESAHGALRAAILSRWRKVVHAGILLFLVSGLYNYLFVTRFQHEAPSYHMLFGIKFLLAFPVFFLALVLSSSKPYAAWFQRNLPLWSGVMILLAVVVVMLGGYMKALH